MTHIPANSVNMVGLLAGGIAISISVWFQWVTPKEVKLRYIIPFHLLGWGLILLNTGGVVPSIGDHINMVLQTVAYALILTFEIIYAFHIWSNEEVVHPKETVEMLSDEI